jgi:hypothetical protein
MGSEHRERMKESQWGRIPSCRPISNRPSRPVRPFHCWLRLSRVCWFLCCCAVVSAPPAIIGAKIKDVLEIAAAGDPILGHTFYVQLPRTPFGDLLPGMPASAAPLIGGRKGVYRSLSDLMAERCPEKPVRLSGSGSVRCAESNRLVARQFLSNPQNCRDTARIPSPRPRLYNACSLSLGCVSTTVRAPSPRSTALRYPVVSAL